MGEQAEGHDSHVDPYKFKALASEVIEMIKQMDEIQKYYRYRTAGSIRGSTRKDSRDHQTVAFIESFTIVLDDSSRWSDKR